MSDTPANVWTPGMPSPNPGGRPKLPAWLTGKSDELLRLAFQAAATGRLPLAAPYADDAPETDEEGNEVPPERSQIVSAKDRCLVIDRLLDRILGKPGTAEGHNEETANAILAALLGRGKVQ